MMWTDPIVDEIRANAKKWSDQFGGDLHAMFEELRRLERESGENIVSLPPRPAEVVSSPIAPLLSSSKTNTSQQAV
jgi:hypothetical protein